MLDKGLATPYWYSRETTQVIKVTLTGVLSRTHPGQTIVLTESHDAAAWEVLVVQMLLLFMRT